FGWSFTDYGPSYSAFEEGLDGGFQTETNAKPLPILYSENLEETLRAVESAGGRILRPIFSFPGGRRFHFADPAGNELAVWSETLHALRVRTATRFKEKLNACGKLPLRPDQIRGGGSVRRGKRVQLLSLQPQGLSPLVLAARAAHAQNARGCDVDLPVQQAR